MPLTFSVKFHARSTHWVSVILHKKVASMRCALTKHGHEDSSHTDAACWQANNPGKDNCVAEIHLAREKLYLGHIIHECCHAAYHRAILIGIQLSDDSFQEYVANDTGELADALVAFLDHEKIPIRYETVKTRRMI